MEERELGSVLELLEYVCNGLQWHLEEKSIDVNWRPMMWP